LKQWIQFLVEPTIFEPRLKFKPRLKFFKFGLRFTIIPFKYLADQVWIRYQCLSFLNITISNCSFSKKITKSMKFFFYFTYNGIKSFKMQLKSFIKPFFVFDFAFLNFYALIVQLRSFNSIEIYKIVFFRYRINIIIITNNL